MCGRFTAICLTLAAAFTAQAQSVLTANYDNARTNANLSETILTPGTVGPDSFGKLFTLSVDGQIYAQPLYISGMSIAGGTHNVVFVATMHNSIYAFDADKPATPLWTVNLGPSIPASTFDTPDQQYTDVYPEIGILGTPVIDASTGTLYAVAGTLDTVAPGKTYPAYRLHALDTLTGAERFGAPVVISGMVNGVGDASANGSVAFDAAQHIQRPGLALSDGVVYIAFGSHADTPPFHGWLFAYSAMSVQTQLAVFNPTPNGTGGAIWQSGRAPAIDASGNIYVVTSNGDTDGVTNFSDSVLRLNPRSLTLADWFAPSNVQTLDDTDDDLGAMGAMLIPNTDFAVTGGKQGLLYLLQSSNLGKLNSTDEQVPQKFQPVSFGIFNAALWPRQNGATLYVHGANGPVQAHNFGGSKFATAPSSQSVASLNVPFQGMTLSASGGKHGSGILWMTTADSFPLPSAGMLRGYNADDLTSELWDSGMDAGDALGVFSKFANPTVANGKVYVPTCSNQLVVYGLDPAGSQTPAITAVTNAASYASGAIAPGEMLAIFGQNLGPRTLAQGQWSSARALAQQAGGAEVTFNGVPAPVLYASSAAISTIAPFGISGLNQVSIQVGVSGAMSAVDTVPVTAAAPGLFALDSTGRGPGAILNEDYSVNSATNPAAAGSIVLLYATGGGIATGQGPASNAAKRANRLVNPVSVTVGGQPATVLYAGSAPGLSNGVVQVNVQLPPDVTGAAPVVLTVAGAASQQTVTVAIQ